MKGLDEEMIEQEALEILQNIGYQVLHGPDISPDGSNPMRELYSEVVLTEKLRDAIYRLNPDIPPTAKEEAVKKVIRADSPDLLTNNQHFHLMLTDGVDVEYRQDDRIIGDKVWLFDFEETDNNDFLAVNQFTIIENNINRRPDIVLFINGLPLVVIELKNPVHERATIKAAFRQFETYKNEITSLFHFNEILVISDGIDARTGTITSDFDRFMPWKTIEGEIEALKTLPEMEVVLKGMLNKKVLLDLLRHFIVFESDGRSAKKKIAAYHQYHAANKAVDATIQAASPQGDKRCGVIWHTQGSGKSLIMAFYTGKLVLEMDNPTIVVLTDRNDLDDQLFGTFASCSDLLRQEPVQAENRDHLKKLLQVSSGGIVFTTIQKFLPGEGAAYPTLSERRNIVVIADEAHRSQYDFIDGFARHMRDALPNASFIGFTGTPLERGDRNTRAVFGNYIDIYDIEQAVDDGATVRIFYESRLIPLELIEEVDIDGKFDNVTEQEKETDKERLKSKWARMEAIVGSPTRIKKVAEDIVYHFQERYQAQEGKGMIVGMSRRICVDLYNEIIKLKPEWEHEDDDKGFLKVVMTGSASDPQEWQKHIRNKEKRKRLGDLFKESDSEIKLVIVRDMWLTGFDVPSLHTMYLDKPMRGHGLMQAIARVNRVYGDKTGGLIVDYLGIAADLKEALSQYTDSGGRGAPTFDQEEAVALMLEKYEILKDIFHGFNYQRYFIAERTGEKIRIVKEAMDFILGLDDGKKRFLKHVSELSKAFSLSVPHERAMDIKDEVGFFQGVSAAMQKSSGGRGASPEDLDLAIRQIVSKSIAPGELEITKGVKDISILSPAFLKEFKDMPQENLAAELLEKLLNEEIRVRSSKNVVEARKFSEMLKNTIERYNVREIKAEDVIAELIDLANHMSEADKRGEELGLTEYELAFYDALTENQSPEDVMEDEELKKIAMDLVKTIKKNITIDWTLRESIQAKLRVAVKRVLRKHGYPSNKQSIAVQTVLEQANRICEEWVESVI
jgi:type I restriction enzyme R subunit